jgi:hypothetical protein
MQTRAQYIMTRITKIKCRICEKFWLRNCELETHVCVFCEHKYSGAK